MNKLLAVSVSIFCFSIKSVVQSRIIAEIDNISNDKGVCQVCLFNNEASFNGKTGAAFQCLSVPVSNKKSQAVFSNVPAGTYAISVFHDANNNNKLVSQKKVMVLPGINYPLPVHLFSGKINFLLPPIQR